MNHLRGGLRAAAVASLLVLVACSGGGGSGAASPPPKPPLASNPPASKAEAFRFLNQATFGATEAEATRLIALGDSTNAYSRWIDAEITKPVSTLLPTVEAAYPNPVPLGFNIGSLNAPRVEEWFDHTLRGSDQLRQRVAWALSQIGALQNFPFATADFYDMLARDALGDFRKLLEDVTLHPTMGVYLSMLGNQKAVVGTNAPTRPGPTATAAS